MIRLEKFEQSDFKQLIEWISDEEVMTKWAGNLFRFPLTEKSLAWYIDKANIKGSSSAFIYKAVDSVSGNTVGHISIGGISWKNRAARVTRVFVGDSDRNKGCCQQMITALLKISFEELKLHRVGLGVYDNNKAALICYEKSGFKIEGISRDILWYKRTWWSMVEMSILEEEWRELFPGK